MAHLFHPPAAFGLVQALHLSELLAAFARELAQASAGRTCPPGRAATPAGHPHIPPPPAGTACSGQ
jgi:hypothetical protein